MTSEAYLCLFVAICIATNMGFGKINRGRVPAGIVLLLASTTSVVLYQSVGYLIVGYRHPFFEIAAFVEIVLSLAIGAATLWIMHKFERTKN